MSLIVQKYGGTSVANFEKIRRVAERISQEYDKGNDMVVVLSAMAGDTDRLINLTEQIYGSFEKRELDVLLATGEQTTVSLLAMTLQAMGYRSCSLQGYQVRVITDSCYGNARIIDIEPERIRELLEKRIIVVVAGFQGSDSEGNITTLGRGGSDTSAVAISAALKADLCEIYTDVDGVFTADPSICSKAQKLPKISYDEMLEMASLGAKVLQSRSVEFAKKYNIPVYVRSSFNDKEGTMVVQEDTDMEKLVVSGVTCSKADARITLKKIPDQPGIAAKIFTPISEAGVVVDMIIQNTRLGGQTDLTFTVPKVDYENALQISSKVAKDIGAEDVFGDKNIAKVSVTGVGMKSNSGVASTMFSTLASDNINIILISTSEIRVSCVIEEKYAELAVQILHAAFGLDGDQANVSIYYSKK